jgi:hypothetical protein
MKAPEIIVCKGNHWKKIVLSPKSLTQAGGEKQQQQQQKLVKFLCDRGGCGL